jgi:hypothetical protein
MGPSLLSRIESALPQCAWKADGVLSLPLSKSFRNAARLEPCWMLSHQTASPASGGGPAIRHCSVQVAPALLPLDFGIVQAECSLAQTRTKFSLNRKKHLHMASSVLRPLCDVFSGGLVEYTDSFSHFASD